MFRFGALIEKRKMQRNELIRQYRNAIACIEEPTQRDYNDVFHDASKRQLLHQQVDVLIHFESVQIVGIALQTHQQSTVRRVSRPIKQFTINH